MKKRHLFLSGTGLVSLHLIDALAINVEPGASLARHLPTLAVTLAVAAAAALTYERLPRGLRAAAAGVFSRVVSFRSTANIRLHASYVPGRNGAAIWRSRYG
jgi:hypothetical protein